MYCHKTSLKFNFWLDSTCMTRVMAPYLAKQAVFFGFLNQSLMNL